MIRWGRLAIASALLGVTAAVVGVIWRGGLPLSHPNPWLPLEPGIKDGYSGALGLSVGALVVLATRGAVARFAWARRLHSELRPVARGLTNVGIVALAVFSSLGEEVLFRGLLTPWIGLVPQALIFGLVHQVPGQSRCVYATWATVMGLILGAMFQLTGSLAGPILAHALVNALNLLYLKRHDPSPPQRRLGGLLGQRS